MVKKELCSCTPLNKCNDCSNIGLDPKIVAETIKWLTITQTIIIPAIIEVLKNLQNEK